MRRVPRGSAGHRLLPAAFAIALLAACGSGNTGSVGASAGGAGGRTPPPGVTVSGTGITGTVLLGPACPVQSAANPCPDRPVVAPVIVRDQGGREVARGVSDTTGRFSVAVSPGAYAVTAEATVAGPALRSPIQAVTVVSGRTTEIVLAVDSGIR